MILFFSGTGNSRYVADSLSDLLSDDGIFDMSRGGVSGSPATTGIRDRVIWVFPVHSWGLPKVVRRFIDTVTLDPILDGAMHYMVATCGDDAGLTHQQWRSAVKRRGWKAAGSFTVIMPNTYIALPGFNVDPVAVACSKLEAAGTRIREVARAIRVGAKVDDVCRGAMPWLKTRAIYPLFMGALTSPGLFRVRPDACIGCGRCVKACPLGNVRISESETPVWSRRCTMCLACYHVCPRHAIEYGPFTRGKGQYMFNKSFYESCRRQR
ncbi:MAG: EFR1 family ferrodoxin [Muribaculaceae bacterium]|nr:EFR1 family ferrodoxin [Muribaculaceae bacterium]